jgi:hypothetical protein
VTASTADVRPLPADDAAWLATIPTAIVAVAAITLLGPPLGKALLAPQNVHFWPGFQYALSPEPVQLGRFLVAQFVPFVLAIFTVAGVRWRAARASSMSDGLIVAVQAAAVAFAVACWLAQEEALGPLYPHRSPQILLRFFTPRTMIVAGAGTLAIVLAVRNARMRAQVLAWARESRGRRLAAGLVAIVAIVVWLLHGVYTEGTIGAAFREVEYHIQFTYDETFAVLDGLSPLVNYATQYGSLWSYAFAAGMSLIGPSVGVWVAMALLATGLGMLAVFAVLRWVAGTSVRGLLLFLPVLATSFFMLGGTLENRYTYANYFGTFPMRYAGPSILAWLVARHLGGARPRQCWPLFLLAGVVVLNNADTGIPALGATALALLWSGGRPTRASVARLAFEATGGLAAAFALVSLLTLARAGVLPDLGLLLRFSRLFAKAGFGLFAMPTIGLHLVVYLTFVAALGAATVRALRAEPDRLLTGMLAWSAAFGLGAGAYFAGRAVPENLVAMFFPWAFATALLLIPALRSLSTVPWRRPPVAAVACVFGFGVMACSLAQTPTPWGQLQRLQQTVPPILGEPLGEQFVARRVRRGESAAILLPLGHRIGAALGVTDVSPYSSFLSMPTAEQLNETLAVLRADGGRKLFIRPLDVEGEIAQALADAGFKLVAQEPAGRAALLVDSRAR